MSHNFLTEIGTAAGRNYALDNFRFDMNAPNLSAGFKAAANQIKIAVDNIQEVRLATAEAIHNSSQPAGSGSQPQASLGARILNTALSFTPVVGQIADAVNFLKPTPRNAAEAGEPYKASSSFKSPSSNTDEMGSTYTCMCDDTTWDVATGYQTGLSLAQNSGAANTMAPSMSVRAAAQDYVDRHGSQKAAKDLAEYTTTEQGLKQVLETAQARILKPQAPQPSPFGMTMSA